MTGIGFAEVARSLETGFSDCPLASLSKAFNPETVNVAALDKPVAADAGAVRYFADYMEASGIDVEHVSRVPRSGGIWTGEAGDSEWKPDRDAEPSNPKTNPEHKTWGEILDEYGTDGIPFHDGEPDFSEVSKGEVEIEDYSDSRNSNFIQADEKMAEQRGCTPEEVEKWRKENGYTWHECMDCCTMQKVPTEVHGNIPHSGGIAACKAQNGAAETRG